MTIDLLTPIGNAILDSFWWISAVSAVLAILLRLSYGQPAGQRYVMAFMGLLAAPVAFLAVLHLEAAAGEVLLPAGARFDGTDWARGLAIAWCCGVVALSLRTLGGWMYLRSVIGRAVPSGSIESLARRMRVCRPVELRTTVRGDSPFTVGWRRPVIVVPLATMSGLPADQMEAILLHELAHIRRFDYVAEWGLQAIETLFFYHPAVWWMTAMVRREREYSCDEMAIAAGADPACYARALVSMEEMRVPMLAAGWANADVRSRVARILGDTPRPAVWPVVCLLALTLVAQQVPTAYQRWVAEDVFYLIQPEERRAFEQLRTDEERERFIGQFWERRDPTPGTPANEMKEEHYRRIAYSIARFSERDKAGWRTERGRTYILFGPPDEIESHPMENYEKWFYKYMQGVGPKVTLEFGGRVAK